MTFTALVTGSTKHVFFHIRNLFAGSFPLNQTFQDARSNRNLIISPPPAKAGCSGAQAAGPGGSGAGEEPQEGAQEQARGEQSTGGTRRSPSHF